MRVRIIILMTVALVVSIGSILGVGTTVFYEDKSSYILDYNLTQARSASQSVEAQIQRVLLLIKLLHLQSSDKATADQTYTDNADSVGMRRLLVLKLSAQGTFQPLRTFGDDDGSMVHYLDLLGWDTLHFLNESVLVGKASRGELAVGTLIRGRDGSGTAYVSVITPQLNLPDSAGEFHIFLTDSVGNVLFANQKEQEREASELKSLLAVLGQEKLTSGARKWTSRYDDYLVSYQRLSYRELTVVGMIPESVAFAVVGSLVRRSLVLAVSVLLIAIGLTLVFVKRMTEGLRQMSIITEKVQKGSFNFRIDTRKMVNDEIGALATSFNSMAEKIDSLMIEVEARIQGKTQKETNTAVHENLFPAKVLDHANLNFGGASMFAKECGGDWWYYDRVGDYLVMVVGKVETRGIPAALITSATHGAASTFADTMRGMPTVTPSIHKLARALNSAVYLAGRGKMRMAAFIGLYDFQTGILQMVNCAYAPPILHRIPFGGRPENPAERFSVLTKLKHPALGIAAEVEFQAEGAQLKPSDMVFWTSPALMRIQNIKGEMIDQKAIFKMLAELYDNYEGQSGRISKGLIEKSAAFLGDIAQDLPDDVTVVAASVPKKAYFIERVEAVKAVAKTAAKTAGKKAA